MHRLIYVTALASFVALSTQSAFADTESPAAAKIAAPALADTTSLAAPALQQAASTVSMSGAPSVRINHAARIPGTFAINGTEAQSEYAALEEMFRLRVLHPALAGDGGG